MTAEPPELNLPSADPYGENLPPTITTPTAIIHSRYDLDSVPPKPSTGVWTRFVCISDTHEYNFDVPHGDVLLHSGMAEDSFALSSPCHLAHRHGMMVNV